MSQQTMSQLASLASRPDPAADTLAHYQALPVAHHQLEEATYESEALGVEQPSVRQHQVAGKSWESVCKTWWENFASMCVYAWRSAWFSGADLGRLRNHSIAMGAAHNELQWGKLLWTHLWIDHMYYFAKKGRILSKFSCSAMEGSHRRLKRMLRNSGGLSLLRGRLGVQVVVDNHTIDDSLWLHGWDATKRAQHGQGPISVQTYASRTRRRLLTDMQHLQTLQRRFRCRKRRT